MVCTLLKTPQARPHDSLKFASRYLDGDSNFKIEAFKHQTFDKTSKELYDMGVLGGTQVSMYIVRCPDGNHLGCPYWDKVILNFLNVRTQLHNVFNNHKS